jgi:hypothetical protein
MPRDVDEALLVVVNFYLPLLASARHASAMKAPRWSHRAGLRSCLIRPI